MCVTNLLADNSQELEKLKPCFSSPCEYRISSNNLLIINNYDIYVYMIQCSSETCDMT